ncbi:MAG TPA: hypothetical protein VKE71_00645 [Candidatus Angelobacter sp.]|nr:hypothetical protein [Candidatus Angelobacter sp.]
MRRLLAITVIAALICSTGRPVWANACVSMQKTPLCHRALAHLHAAEQTSRPVHHCDSMEQQDDTSAPESARLTAGHAKDCPMQCCTQAKAGVSSAVAATAFIAILLSSENHVGIPAVVFSTPGFSSHTDRGPPIA